MKNKQALLYTIQSPRDLEIARRAGISLKDKSGSLQSAIGISEGQFLILSLMGLVTEHSQYSSGSDTSDKR